MTIALAGSELWNSGTWGNATISKTAPTGTKCIVVAHVIDNFDNAAFAASSMVHMNTSRAFTRIGGSGAIITSEVGGVEFWYLSSASTSLEGTSDIVLTANSTYTGESCFSSIFYLSGAGEVLPRFDVATAGVQANPSLSLLVDQRVSLALFAIFSGLAAPTNITLGSGLTARDSSDFGQSCGRTFYQSSASSSDFTASLTASSDDVAFMGVSFTDALVNADTYRWRNDDGNETGATWIATAGTNIELNVPTGGGNKKVRLRKALSAVEAVSNFKPHLEYAYEEGYGGLISNMSYNDSFSIASQSGNPAGMHIDDTGTHGYQNENDNDTIYEYGMSTGWTLSTCSYQNRSYTYSQASAMTPIYITADGTKMFTGDPAGLWRYSLSTPFNISTMSYDTGQYYDWDALLGNGSAFSLAINSDGTVVFCGDTNGFIWQFRMTTPWDLTTMSYTGRVFEHTQSTGVRGLFVNREGTKMYVQEYLSASPDMWAYTLSDPWNVSTASYDSISYDDSTRSIGVAFVMNPTRLKCIRNSSNQEDSWYSYNLNSMGWEYYFRDLTTSSYKVRAADSSYLTHAADTTQQITTGTFITPNSGISETGIAGTDNDMDFTAGSKCEAEYVIEFVETELTNQAVRFKIGNVDTRSYTYAQVWVSKLSASAGYIKVWTGSQWVWEPVKYWTGSQWTQKPLKYWNGSQWTLTSGT